MIPGGDNVVMRPITLDDLDQLVELAGGASFGLTTLPKDRELLSKRIEESQRGFDKNADRPGGELYLFVMEDLDTGRIVGTSGVVSKVGGFEPFYAYRIESTVHESKMLGVRKEVRALHLAREHNGPCEIGSLFLLPGYRRSGNGRLLSQSRLLFMAEHARCFAPLVIAELRGVLDEHGRSPFWDAIGRHFFEIDYPKADYLSMVDKQFIADLMPTHPIYIPLLPQAAQDVIGQVHHNTRPARGILEREGFRFNNMVDIFEAGPILSCELDDIRTCQRAGSAVVGPLRDMLPAATPAGGDPDATPHLIGNTLRRFRACLGCLSINADGQATLDHATAKALDVSQGDRICYATLRPATAGHDADATQDTAKGSTP